jgi:hypothetical protein
MKSISLFIALFLTICVNAQSKKELEDQILKLNNDIELLKTELSSNKVKNQEISGKLNELTSKLEECRTKYEVCSEDKLKMMERQNSLITQNQRFQFIIDSLKTLPKEENLFMVSNPKNKEDSMRMTIQKYLLTSSISERLKYIVMDKKTSDRMNSYYAEGIRPKEIKTTEIGFGKQVGVHFEVFANNSRYYLKNVAGTYMINWEASVGYNDVNLTTFESNGRPLTEVKVVATLRNYYNYKYEDKESQYLSILLEDPISGAISGYVSRNSPLGKTMTSLLSDGQGHRITIQIAMDQNMDANGDSCTITKLVSESWLGN